MTVSPSPPRKAKTRKTRRRRILVDRMTQLSPDVIKRNVHSGGQETLCERVSSKSHPNWDMGNMVAINRGKERDGSLTIDSFFSFRLLVQRIHL